jgi:hydroxymethylpyrimidine pyrophosphatase-like HAD family hydrolase
MPQALVSPREVKVGDMPNDVLMFQKSGLSIARGNASPEVQRQARFVTTSNEEEGFANVIDACNLGERGEFAENAS